MKLFAIVHIKKNKAVDFSDTKKKAKKTRDALNKSESKDKDNPNIIYKVSPGPDHWRYHNERYFGAGG